MNQAAIEKDQMDEKSQGFYWAEPLEHAELRGPGLLPDVLENNPMTRKVDT